MEEGQVNTSTINAIANSIGESTRICKRDVPKQVINSLDNICTELGKVYKYLDGKPNVEFLLSIVGTYRIMMLEGTVPDRTPEEILRDDLIPYFNSVELEVETSEEGYDAGQVTGDTREEVS